jgi:hypothetical protein
VSKPSKAEYAGFQSSLCRRQGRILKTEEKKMEKEQQGFDINAIVKELDEEFANEVEDQPEESVDEPEEDLDTEDTDDEEEVLDDEEELFEDSDDEVVEDDEEDDEELANLKSDDVHKRNEAFRKLRQERDELAESEKFIKELAKQYGLTKEQLVERFEKDQIKKEAEEQGLTETQVRKMREMETKLQQVEEEKNREVFNIKADALSSKYTLNEGQMITLFEEAAKMGLDIIKNPNLLEFAYRAVNYDEAVNKGRQKQLETTKKRSKTSTGATGTKGREPIVTDDEQWDKEIDSLLKDLNI